MDGSKSVNVRIDVPKSDTDINTEKVARWAAKIMGVTISTIKKREDQFQVYGTAILNTEQL